MCLRVYAREGVYKFMCVYESEWVCVRERGGLKHVPHYYVTQVLNMTFVMGSLTHAVC